MTTKDEEGGLIYKRWWNDSSTKLLITEFRKYYHLWRTGKINKKKRLWQKVAESMSTQGDEFTAEQVENRFKTLQRSYRKSRGINNIRHQRVCNFQKDESDTFIQTLINDNYMSEDGLSSSDPVEHITDNQVEEITEDLEDIQSTIPMRLPRSRFTVPRRPAPKSSIDVLLEIKDLMRKVEIRRQVRHEEHMRILVERNDILRRKNELVEQLLLRDSNCKGELFIQ